MFSVDGSSRCSTGYSILRQTHSTRDPISLAAGNAGTTPSGNGHAGRPEPSDGEGGCMVTCELPETSACGTTGNDRGHEPIYLASPFSFPYCDESSSVSEAASLACGATAHAHE